LFNLVFSENQLNQGCLRRIGSPSLLPRLKTKIYTLAEYSNSSTASRQPGIDSGTNDIGAGRQNHPASARSAATAAR
jgi:hypothetical protein